jgi:hypothetical protein
MMRWAGHVARMWEGRNVYRVLVGNRSELLQDCFTCQSQYLTYVRRPPVQGTALCKEKSQGRYRITSRDVRVRQNAACPSRAFLHVARGEESEFCITHIKRLTSYHWNTKIHDYGKSNLVLNTICIILDVLYRLQKQYYLGISSSLRNSRILPWMQKDWLFPFPITSCILLTFRLKRLIQICNSDLNNFENYLMGTSALTYNNSVFCSQTVFMCFVRFSQ